MFYANDDGPSELEVHAGQMYRDEKALADLDTATNWLGGECGRHPLEIVLVPSGEIAFADWIGTRTAKQAFAYALQFCDANPKRAGQAMQRVRSLYLEAQRAEVA